MTNYIPYLHGESYIQKEKTYLDYRNVSKKTKYGVKHKTKK